MSLGGIAIAIGEMVDAGVVMVENAHKHLERARRRATASTAILDACREVGPALFFSLLIITVSFLPVFALEAQEGRLFAPLAYTKTFAMLGGALVSVTLLPVLMVLPDPRPHPAGGEEPAEPVPDRVVPARASRSCCASAG